MMEQRPFEDYRFMEQCDRDFVIRFLFLDYLETVDFNRRKKKGPQFIKTIIQNDLKEHVRLQNYEACMVIYDMKDKFRKEIDLHDDLL